MYTLIEEEGFGVRENNFYCYGRENDMDDLFHAVEKHVYIEGCFSTFVWNNTFSSLLLVIQCNSMKFYTFPVSSLNKSSEEKEHPFYSLFLLCPTDY